MKYFATIGIAPVIFAIVLACLTYLMNTCQHEAGRSERVRMQLDAIERMQLQHGDVVRPGLDKI